MSTIHFLNVNEGDCTWIHHDSGRNTVIDISNGNDESNEDYKYDGRTKFGEVTEAVRGNFNQKCHPVNPIKYLKYNGVSSIFRFILTHPDMDHMDGIKALFGSFKIENFWDTKNNKKMDSNSKWGKYHKEDWEFYQRKRKSAIHYYSGDNALFFNQDKNGGYGDSLYILAPTEDLVKSANESGDYNDCSYVLLYAENNHKIIFAGDSGQKTWDYILEEYESCLSDIDILFAPHHGRKTGGNDDYIKVLKPRLTVLGNADSQYLDYATFHNNDLEIITNNQGGNIVVDVSIDYIDVYVSNETFAKANDSHTQWSTIMNAWYLKKL